MPDSIARENQSSSYEKPEIIWEDSFKSTTQAQQAISCAKEPLQSYVCDSRPVT